jgi:hypothetical protein
MLIRDIVFPKIDIILMVTDGGKVRFDFQPKKLDWRRKRVVSGGCW